MKLLILAFCAACAFTPPQRPDVNGIVVVSKDNYCANRHACRGWAPFVRWERDPVTAGVFWLTGADGRGCEVTGLEQSQAKVGEPYACDWRTAR